MRGASKASAERGAGPEASGGAGAFVVLGVLAACVAGAAGYRPDQEHHQAAQRRPRPGQVRAAAGAAGAGRRAASRTPTSTPIAKARVQTVRDLAGSRFDWEQALRDLSRAIPADVTLKHAHGRHRHRRRRPAASSLRGAISAPAITLTGCAPGQTQVARLMARLRDIDGVTRVSLTSPTRPRSTSTRRDRHATRAGPQRARRAARATVPPSRSSCSSRATRRRSRRRRRTANGSRQRHADPDRRPRPRRTDGAARPPTTTDHHDLPEGRPREPHLPRSCSWLSSRSSPPAATGSSLLSPKRAEAADPRDPGRVAQAQLAQHAEPDRDLQRREGRLPGQLRDGRAARQGRADRRRHALAARPARRRRQAQRRRLRHDQRRRAAAAAPATGHRRGATASPRARSTPAPSRRMPFSLAFTGTFDSLGNFFARLERFVTLNGDTIEVNGRLLRIETISLAPGDDGWPGIAGHGRRQLLHRPRDRARPPATTATGPATATSTSTTATSTRPPRLRARRADLARPDEPDHRTPAQALVRRKLWPVALLLVAALVAVPLTLAKQPEATAGAPATRRRRQDRRRHRDHLRVRCRRRTTTHGRRQHDGQAPPHARRGEGPVRAGAAAEGQEGRRRSRPRPDDDDDTTHQDRQQQLQLQQQRRELRPATAPAPAATPTPTPTKTYPADSIHVRFGHDRHRLAAGQLLKRLTPPCRTTTTRARLRRPRGRRQGRRLRRSPGTVTPRATASACHAGRLPDAQAQGGRDGVPHGHDHRCERRDTQTQYELDVLHIYAKATTVAVESEQ